MLPRASKIVVVPLAALRLVFARDATAQQGDTYDDNDPSALVDFHATLDPVGQWADDPTYGAVWVPDPGVVGPDFVPYATGGHWAYGDDYTWVSDYDWGWAPFHYGRWVYAGDRGWSWVPGREYAPAWVDWRVGLPGVDFVGWAPAPPTFLWRGGLPVTVNFPVPPRFVFCGSADIFHPRVFERIVRGPRVDAIAVRMRPFDEHPWGGGRRFFGPPPARIGVEPARVVRFTGTEPGLVHAREFARPSLAIRYGAHPPARPGAAFDRPGEHRIDERREEHVERVEERHDPHPGSAAEHGAVRRAPEPGRAPIQAHGGAHRH